MKFQSLVIKSLFFLKLLLDSENFCCLSLPISLIKLAILINDHLCYSSYNLKNLIFKTIVIF